MQIISLLLAIVSVVITYKLLENYGFKTTCTVRATVTIIILLIRSKFTYILPIVIASIIASLIESAVDYFFFTHSNSFWIWLLYEIIFAILLSVLIFFIVVALDSSNVFGFLR